MTDEREQVVLVSPFDDDVGVSEKLEVHRTGDLHRAFSVFVFDDYGRMLLQRRARTKYHSGGLWSNTSCGHPRPGEQTIHAAARRLQEEMGITSELSPSFSFIYRAMVSGDLIEHELDHVFIGHTSDQPNHNPAEVDEWRWVNAAEVREWVTTEPTAFTAWFGLAFEGLMREADKSLDILLYSYILQLGRTAQ